MQFSHEDILRFAEWSADVNPLHVDPAFARSTHFGQCIAHGMLSVIRALASTKTAKTGGQLSSLDIEFRGAVIPGVTYTAESSRRGDDLSVAMRGPDGLVLQVRATTGSRIERSLAPDSLWAAAAVDSPVRVPLRHEPIARTTADIERGLEVEGVHETAAPPGEYVSGALQASDVHILGLCSYVVGMEVPGLRSLFTRLTLELFDQPSSGSVLFFRVRTVRFDPTFRVLDTRIDIASPDGRAIAAGTIRSYVPLGQQATDLDELGAHLAPETERLDGRVAFVTGGNRGLGADISAALALAGCHVYVASRSDSSSAEQLRKDLSQRGHHLEWLQGDAGNADWCRAALEQLQAKHGRLDLVVLNACGAPSVLRLTADASERQEEYLRENLRLITVPLSLSLPALEAAHGSAVFVSSSFVDEAPAGFSHYVALKQAGEGLLESARHENPGISTLIARPPRLQTTWNDTPTGVAGAIPSWWAALRIVNGAAESLGNSRGDLLSAFPAFPRAAKAPVQNEGALKDFPLRVVASFTTDPLLPGLKFWMRQLGIRPQIEMAPYGQILQSLLDPSSLFAARGGLNIVLLRVRDWLHDLPPEQSEVIDFIRPYLQRTAQDLEAALRAHRGRASAETVLVVCPSYGAASSAESILLRQTEGELVASMTGIPGLTIVAADDFQARYRVNEDEVRDAIREQLAHIPYKEQYYHLLATLVARQVHRRTAPLRKVVVVDCDNTLWSGVVGESGAEGITFGAAHLALQDRLTSLTQRGMLVCLCSKNEESDVWRVFETRPDFRLRRDDVVAAEINWRPKSESLRAIAAKLNLGSDSFIFIDDNPVECAEVRARCPEVLTLQWPTDEARALQLLEHAWELDAVQATAEDAKRAQMYREEFKRQESLQGAHTFADFIGGLGLQVDVAPLANDDLRRAAQLTLRTNQFNFTTIRREESDVKSLTAGGRHEVRTIRVRDRFGDYGLVGLVIAEQQGQHLLTDTFLLSCRVLGRGVEHRIAAELGQMALDRGLDTVRMRVESTKRNTPARNFLDSIASIGVRRGDERALECDFRSDALAKLEFVPTDGVAEVVEENDPSAAPAGTPAGDDALRRREELVARTAFEWSDLASLQAAIEDRPASQRQPARAEVADIAAAVYAAFAQALRVSEDYVKEIDGLEALGCDSLKIVEITVALLEKFPWLPSTLLFEHRSVRALLKEAGELAAASATPAVSARTGVTPADATRTADDIAVVGLHVRCAGANSPDELWDLLSSSRSAVRPVDRRRKHFLHELSDDRPHFAALLDDAGRFDAEFFGVSPREAEFVDPQLRVFLEVAWNALEDAGSTGVDRDAETGVFVGVMYGDYSIPANLGARAAGNAYRCWEGFSLANRLSQLLDLRGPSLAVDTACSSSGTALHLAVRAINAGDCRVALVGGVNLILDPDRFGSLGRLGILSATGKCEPFGANADGTVLGEGAGAVVLRPLRDALQRGDRIYGVIKGTGLSTGSGTVGFTAPNPQAQADAIRRALAAARVDPRTVSYVETHGTGTALGDPIEVRGLTLGYGSTDTIDPSLDLSHRCRIGSIKPNVGHLEAGAGIIGLIKVLLQMQRGMLLPSLTSDRPSPHIPFGEIPFDVQRTLEEWPRLEVHANGGAVIPRRAALSSFGVGGANAHVIVEEAPATSPAARAIERPLHLLPISGTTAEALDRQIAAVRAFVDSHPDLSLADLGFCAGAGHAHFEHRFALPVAQRDSVLAHLGQAAEGRIPPGAFRATAKSGRKPVLAFLFTGQGSQYAGMGRRLYETQPVFRDALDRCARIFDQLLGEPLLALLFAEAGTELAARLNQTGFTQPALFAFEYALAELWRSWGIVPDVVMGHSVGEIAAMCVAGGISLNDGLKLIAARGRLMQALPAGGSMTSVMAEETRVLEAIAGAEDRVAIAAINAPSQIVISGAGVAVAEIASRLEADGVKTRALVVSHAFHSPLMRPMLADYERVVRSVAFSTPTIPFISCVDGALVSSEVTRPDYWIRQVTDPVRFAAGMQVAESQAVDAYVEIGPHPVLLGMGRECAGDRGSSVAWLPSLRRDTDPWPTILASLARLYTLGAPIDWRGFDAPYARRRTSSVSYAFDRKQYWLREDSRAGASRPLSGLAYELSWRELPALAAPPGASAPRHWVILGQDDAITRALEAALHQPGHRVSVVVPGVRFSQAKEHGYEVDPRNPQDLRQMVGTIVSGSGPPPAFVHLWALGAPPTDTLSSDSLEQAVGLLLGGALHLVQALIEAGTPAPVWFVTKGAVATPAGAAVSIAQAPLWGFGRTLALEHPDVWGGLVDLPPEEGLSVLHTLADELRSSSIEDQIALREARRFGARLVPANPSTRKPTFDADGTYLIAGGTGALGLQVARWLVARGVRHLVLSSRRTMPTPQVEAVSAEVQALGASVSVISADVSREEDVDTLVDGLAKGPHPLRGVFHVAGVDSPTPLRELSLRNLESDLPAKVSGGWLLHKKTLSLPLDTFVVFSSMASLLGSQGRAHYGAANAFLDALIAERARLGLPAVAVNWGPWTGGGMATSAQLSQYARVGNRGLEPARALAVLDGLVGERTAGVLVADIDWRLFRPAYEARRVRPLVSDLGVSLAPVSSAAAREDSWIDQLRATPAPDRRARLEALLRVEVAETLGFDRSEEVPLDKSFYDAGMDSLMTADLVGRLRKHLGVSISALVFDHPDVRSLADQLIDRLPIEGEDADDKATERAETAADAGANGVRIVEYTSERKNALVEFQLETFPDRMPPLIGPRFEWMFLESATRAHTKPHVWLCEEGDRIAGQMGAIPVRLQVGEAQHSASWFVDSMVREGYRHLALGTKLLVRGQEDVPLALSLGQTPEMRQIQFRLGWKQIGPLQTAQMLIKPERVLRGKVPAPVAWAAGLGLRASTAVRDLLSSRPAAAVREISRFGAAHDGVWQKMSRDLICAVVRDAAYLNWKYVDQPGQRFLRLELIEDDEPKAIVVCMFKEPDGVYNYGRAFIVELLAPPSDQRVVFEAIQAAAAAAADAGADSLTCLHVGGWLTRALRRCGFHVRTPERMLLIHPGLLDEQDRERALEERNWFVTQGDSDLDRPQ